MSKTNTALQVNLFAWRVQQQKKQRHKREVNKLYTERPRLRHAS
ncbi:MAG: hypothetical protein VX740_06520 [Pseudomonadota bacterium]|jgi:hypothetical protein|nr:hypothetical protein [Alphaproteobacteria bacterium]MEC7576137.1 hypothetical protein [Pseudomonadota bacterium]MEC7701907.1 hypothetical protein [Pseudomonadota bacterium]MEC9235067.1 hypothetical protein [Pseudomonadota bacterium]MED5423076.1 hypothetical protein [Pseudomonadota bacterium]|tara:strand:- start:301 stop:432 length:132 start_codon:yes stop_codon:yes gene_type:complete